MDKTAPTWRPRVKAWLPAIVWAGILVGLSSVPGSRLPSVRISLGDKLAHVCVYAILGALCFRALRRTTTIGSRKAVLLSALLTLGFGVSDEIHQMFVPQRSPDMLDVVADVLGGGLGALGGRLAGRRADLRGRDA